MLSAASRVSATPVAIPIGHVTTIEVTYMPTTLRFFLDTGDGTCPIGTPLLYGDATSADKVKSAYAAVLAAFLSGKRISAIYDTTNVSSQPGSCVLTYLYATN